MCQTNWASNCCLEFLQILEKKSSFFMAGNRDLKSLKINRSDFQTFFHKFYSRFINAERQVKKKSLLFYLF